MNKLNEKEIAARDKICMALDFHDESSILKYVEELSDYIGYFKLNFAFTLLGPEIIKKIQSFDVKIFLDLKIHDIPNTVAGYANSVCKLGVDIITVHTVGGTVMMQEIVKACNEFEQLTGNPRPKIIGVTLLTSIDEQTMNSDLNIGGDIKDELLRRAKIAVRSGLDGIVCSAVELHEIKKHLPKNLFYITPGIRAFSNNRNDHKRSATFSEAIAAGSSLLVIGRDLIESDDRIGYVKAIINQIIAREDILNDNKSKSSKDLGQTE